MWQLLWISIRVNDELYWKCCMLLTAHNWQKWKRVFLACPCHKIYRGEAVCLKSCKYTWKIRFMWICGIWGNFVKIWYIVSNCLIEARIWKIFCTCVTHICDYVKHSTFRFNLIDFQLNTDFLSRFCVFYRKITQRHSKIGFSGKCL